MLFTEWFPDRSPIYNIYKSYRDNFEAGPYFPLDLPPRPIPPKTQWISFLDQRLLSPFGVAAGPLLHSRWVALAAALGFDVLVYKTIRSREYPGHSFPNMLYLDLPGMIPLNAFPSVAKTTTRPPHHMEDLAVAHSFDMPSKNPQYLLEDIPRAQAFLKEGQLLIVSVTGTHREECSLLRDFVDAAALARAAGAKVIEINFSLRSTKDQEDALYTSPSHVLEMGLVLAKAMDPIPLILKVGVFDSVRRMRDVFIAAAKAGIRAISGIDGLLMRIENREGNPAFSQEQFRPRVGGGPIRNVALHFVEQAHQIIKEEKLDLELIGVGGITKHEHFFHFLERGARIAMSATGMMWDPLLAMRAHAYIDQRKRMAG